MRVTLFTRQLLRRDAMGGVVISQARALAARGVTVRIVAEQVADAPIDLATRTTVVTSPAALLGGGVNAALTEHVRRSHLAIFHFGAAYDLLDLLAERFEGRKVFDYHGVTPPALWDGPGRADLRAAIAKLPLARHADVAIAHSQFAREELCRGSGLEPARVRVVGYPIDVARFAAAGRAAPAPARAPGRIDLLYVGRMASNKRIHVLVEALAAGRAADLDLRLTLAGDGELTPYRRHLDRALARARALGVREHVRYVGPVEDEDLPALFAASSIYVTASGHEGFCIPVIEAMAAGMPVVAARAGALPETVGEAGLVVAGDPGSLAAAIVRIARDPALRASLVERGRARALDFAPDRQAREFTVALGGMTLEELPAKASLAIADPGLGAMAGSPLAARALDLVVTNEGPGDLPEATLLTASWLDEGGAPLARGAGEATLGRDLAPGETAAVSLSVALPARAGTYRLEARLAHAAHLSAEAIVSIGVRVEGAGVAATAGAATLAAATGSLPTYRDFSHRGWLWGLAVRVRANLTRHLVRNHVDVIARRQAEIAASLAEEIRALRAELAAERAARAAEVADLRDAVAHREH